MKKVVEVEEGGRKVKKVVVMEVESKKVKKTVTEEEGKDVAFVNDVPALLRDVMHQRRMNPATTMIRIGLVGGGGNFKILASLCPMTEEEVEEEIEKEKDEDENAFVEGLMTGISNYIFPNVNKMGLTLTNISLSFRSSRLEMSNTVDSRSNGHKSNR